MKKALQVKTLLVWMRQPAAMLTKFRQKEKLKTKNLQKRSILQVINQFPEMKILKNQVNCFCQICIFDFH
jgi:hypothetical protein